MRFRATYVFILANIVAYAVGFSAPLIDYRNILAYGFTHGSTLHLLFNMLALLTFGLGMERTYGSFGLVLLYLTGIIGGGVWQLGGGDGQAVIGSSAGIYALVLAYAYSNRGKQVMFLVFPMKAGTLGIVAVAIEVACIFFGWLPIIVHWAHLGGALVGITFAWSVSWQASKK